MRESKDGLEFVAGPSGSTGHGRDLVLTNRVAVGQGSYTAGAEVLMAQMGVERLERVLLAGAFGNYLDPGGAARIGLFPSVAKERIQGVGNAAGVGAVMALVSREQRRWADDLAHAMRYEELSGHPLFQNLFVDNMAFPGEGD